MANRVLQPSYCPICRMPNNKYNPLTTLMRNHDDLTRVNFMCGFCGSFFWWKSETREACGLQSRYPLTRQGWNTSIVQIDQKYEPGDVCPRCKGESGYKDSLGSPSRCVICDGSGIYPGD